jgi:hypothetical protein
MWRRQQGFSWRTDKAAAPRTSASSPTAPLASRPNVPAAQVRQGNPPYAPASEPPIDLAGNE